MYRLRQMSAGLVLAVQCGVVEEESSRDSSQIPQTADAAVVVECSLGLNCVVRIGVAETVAVAGYHEATDSQLLGDHLLGLAAPVEEVEHQAVQHWMAQVLLDRLALTVAAVVPFHEADWDLAVTKQRTSPKRAQQ
jgi:hypothetical protein